MIKLVIFDMDGLIFDSEKLYYEIWISVSEKLGYKMTKELWQGLMGTNAVTEALYLKKIFGEDCPTDKFREIRSKEIIDYAEKNGMPLKNGFHELSEYMHKNGIKGAVATSSDRKRTLLYLDGAGITKDFSSITCGDEVHLGKPDPEIFLRAAEKEGALPSECIVLEDSSNGILAASRAGMIPVCVPDMQFPNSETRALCGSVVGRMDRIIGNLI